MATQAEVEQKPQVTTLKNNFESDLALEFLRVVEDAAIASGKTMGQGDRKLADQVATETMRGVMDSVPMDGTIVTTTAIIAITKPTWSCFRRATGGS